MPATLPAIDFTALLKGVPKGAWVAISAEHDRVVTFGADMRTVLETARKMGEKDPVITRVPEASVVML